MSTTLTINANRSALVDQGNPTTNYSTGTIANLNGISGGSYFAKALLVGFSDESLASYAYREILSARLQAYIIRNYPEYAGAVSVCATLLREAWTENAVTYETKPDVMSPFVKADGIYSDRYADFDFNYAPYLRDLFSDGVLLSGGYGYVYSYLFSLQTSRGTYPPQLIVEVSDSDVVPTVNGSPSGGYVNKHAAITLKWNSRINAFTFSPIAQTDATLRWREGSAGEVHEVTELGTLTSYILAAESVAGAELQWQVSVTYNSGAVVTTPWYVCSTVEALSSAEILSPKDTLVDGSDAAALKWRHVITTGTAQAGADVQCSADASTWETILSFFAGSSTLKYKVNAARLSHLFRCAVRDANGNSLESSAVQIVGSAPPIIITAQPQDPVGAVGDEVTFTVTATGTSLSYQWQYLKPNETEWNNVTSSGGTSASYSLTVASRHLTYVYRCQITDGGGHTLLSNEARIRSAAPPIVITTQPQAFVGAVGDLAAFSIAATGTGLHFVWQESADGVSWAESADLSAAVSEGSIPPNTLAAGTAYWRVRTYNTDLAAGEWSAAAQISVVAGPGTPIVACTSDPLPLLSWQVDGQQGFEAEIGGQSSGVVYGTGKSWQPPEYLADGQYTARVRVVNSYGLWGDWGEAVVTIANPGAGAAFAVTAYPDVDVGLTWAAVTGASAYAIYRDGVRIGETAELQYTDRWSNGESVYVVRAIIGSGYRDSAPVTATIRLRYALITDPDGDWLELRYSTEPVPVLQSTHSRPVSLLSVQGSVFPVAEASPHRARAWTITAAFMRGVGSKGFEALLGREVVYKDQYGNLVHGIMASITTTRNRFYDVVSAQLQEIEGVL